MKNKNILIMDNSRIITDKPEVLFTHLIMAIFILVILFSNAELREDIVKDFFVCYFSCYCAYMI